MADLEEILDDENEEIITLLNDDNEEIEFYHIATIDYKEEWYIFLQPVEEMEGVSDDEVIIFKIGTDAEGNDSFEPVEDEEVLQAVFNEFEKMMEEEGCCDEDCDCGCHGEGDGCSCGCHEEK